MRFAAGLCGVLLLLVGSIGCDNDTIAQSDSQTVSLTVSAVNVPAPVYDVFDAYEDNDADFLPDDGTYFTYCVSAGFSINVQSTPWPFGVRVSVLRADSIEFEDLTDSFFLDETTNLAEYDSTELTGSNARAAITVDDNGTMRTFRFQNDRRLTGVNRVVVAGVNNPLADILNNDMDMNNNLTLGNGICSLADLGVPTINGAPAPFTADINKGDTIRVEVRKAFGAALTLPISQMQQAAIAGAITVDGVPTNVTGTSASTSNPGDGFSFFYTAR